MIDLDKVDDRKIEKLISETIKLFSYQEYDRGLEALLDLSAIFLSAAPAGPQRAQMKEAFANLRTHILDSAVANQMAHGIGTRQDVERGYLFALERKRQSGKLITNIHRNTTPH